MQERRINEERSPMGGITPTLGMADASHEGCLAYLLFVLAGTWIIALTIVLHIVAWFFDQIELIEGTPLPWMAWPLISWVHGFLIVLPIGILAAFMRAPRLQAAYQTWILAAAFVFPLGLARAFPTHWTLSASVLQIMLGLFCIVVLFYLLRRRQMTFEFVLRPVIIAFSLVPLVTFPIWVWGALGSYLDTLLALVGGLCLGLYAGLVLEFYLFRPLAQHSRGPGWDIAFGGFVAGVALLILGSGFGLPGAQLLLLIALPPLGFVVAALKRFARRSSDGAWMPIAVFIGLSAAAPLMYFDPDELTLLLGVFGWTDILQWGLLSVIASLWLAWILGFELWVIRRRINGPPRWTLTLGMLCLIWLSALLFALFWRQWGWHGERLFVILRDQAEVNDANGIADRIERLTYIYQKLTRHAEQTQMPIRQTLDFLGIAYTPYYLVNAIEVDGGPFVQAYLASLPEVERILQSPHLRPLPVSPPGNTLSVTDTQPLTSSVQWNISLIGADRVWAELGVRGKGIVIGQSDSGVQFDHPALRGGYRGRGDDHNYNWLNPWDRAHSMIPVDINGHGTHTLGSALGRGGVGVAPEAEWFACANLVRNLGNPALYLDCLQFMLAPYPLQGDPFKDGDPSRAAHVLNNSWGCPPLEGCDALVLAPAVRALKAAGIFVVASAGNEGPRCGSVRTPLAIYPEVFSVGAISRDGTITSFSSRGPVEVDESRRVKPDIVAPGAAILSSYPNNAYKVEHGTSMAGPHVTGVVALMWAAQPRLIGDINLTTEILYKTAKPYTGAVGACLENAMPNNTYGYGMVDAYAAVKAALEMK